jgi:hypothetical protein
MSLCRGMSAFPSSAMPSSEYQHCSVCCVHTMCCCVLVVVRNADMRMTDELLPRNEQLPMDCYAFK